MFDLDFFSSVLLVLALLTACGFEFVNGFHDTANAVATVIYTHTLKPWQAVIWSGIWNCLGVLLGGIAVAVGIINLLPMETLLSQDIPHSLSLIAALLISATFWNLLTWYYGIPCSSSHTLIGAILGVGIANSLLLGSSEEGINWAKAQDIGLSLLVSPLFGFSTAIFLMYILKRLTRGTKYKSKLFRKPKKNAPPPVFIRALLLCTCTLVSFFHGQNDGQKGVGLMMIILISIVPSYFALNPSLDTKHIPSHLQHMKPILTAIDSSSLSRADRQRLRETLHMNVYLQNIFASTPNTENIDKKDKFEVRKAIMVMDRTISSFINNPDIKMMKDSKSALKNEVDKMREITDYSPRWVILLISISLGIGTMIGWKRIVKTVGERIGKEHLNYAQGACAESVAAITIGLASGYGWPVSTTHVLSSGVAGTMVASKGTKNLQPQTLKNILIAWTLTLPVVILLSASLYAIFHWII